MPKPLVLYRVDAQDGRMWLVLSPTKPTIPKCVESLGLTRSQIAAITTATDEDAMHLKPDAEEVAALVIWRE